VASRTMKQASVSGRAKAAESGAHRQKAATPGNSHAHRLA